jgi:signal transduction histidine kinase/DNA-binding response OmpR family regulator
MPVDPGASALPHGSLKETQRVSEADKANILVVDDRPDKHVVFRAVLDELGQNLYAATSGEEALRQVLRREFAVILLDVNMPGLDGLETAALIRSRTKSAHIPIIFISADYAVEVRISKGYSLGAVDYLSSPILPDILRSKVKVFVDLYLLAEQAKRRAEEHLALAEERAARSAAERANARFAFLAQASAALSRSLEFDATAHEFMRLAIPFLADAVALTFPGEEGVAARTELAWTGAPTEQALCAESVSALECGWWRDAIGRVQASGVAESFADLSGAHGGNGSEGAAAVRPEIPRGSPLHSLVIVPLLARGRTIGVISLGTTSPGRTIDADLMAVASDVASRAAIALDNALLYQKIHEQDRRKNEFLAMLSHELRNPLAPITNAVHVMQTNDPDAKRNEWAREVIGRQVKQLARLVDDLLDVSRITQGKIELKIEAVDVAEVVSVAVETVRPLIESQEHALSVLLPEQPMRVRGDFARVAQILANLLNNAAKYTDRKGRISLIAEQEGADIVFRVRDSGIGIPASAVPAIFDLFTQVEHTLDRSQGGLGIGLTLVKRLVEMQGGSVTAVSAGKNLGSEFIVRLPAMAVDQRVAAGRRAAERYAASSPAEFGILIVDDNRDATDSMAMLLKMEGYDVRVAYDGPQALAAVGTARPDVILLDLGLPGMDGFQVAQRVRAEPDNSAIVIVAVSGYGQEEHRSRSTEAGCDHHLVKPIEPSVVSELLASLHSSRHGPSPGNVVRLRRTAD